MLNQVFYPRWSDKPPEMKASYKHHPKILMGSVVDTKQVTKGQPTWWQMPSSQHTFSLKELLEPRVMRRRHNLYIIKWLGQSSASTQRTEVPRASKSHIWGKAQPLYTVLCCCIYCWTRRKVETELWCTETQCVCTFLTLWLHKTRKREGIPYFAMLGVSLVPNLSLEY